MDRRAFLAAVSIFPLAGCASRTEGTLLEALKAARFRLLGEVHDNPEHHAIRARLLDALGRAGLKPAVAFEQFDSEHDPALRDLLLSGKATPESVAGAVRFDRKGWNWEFYRPIVEVALEHGMPLRAANLSRTEARQIARESRPVDGRWSASLEAQLREYIFEGHCRALPESAMPGMVLAQRARDLTMAQALLKPSRDGAVLIAGNSHVRKDFGVPLHLPAVGVVSVGFLESQPETPAPYDFVRVTAAAQRPDPCETFRRK
ncbi:MAG TPA: ChaN family lipoprotein [Burkholderiales bacterium]|nr:ChaN family lipoprotein [Burkholderiales bacterium]